MYIEVVHNQKRLLRALGACYGQPMDSPELQYSSCGNNNPINVNSQLESICGNEIRDLSQKVVDFCYNTRLCIRNSPKCVVYFIYNSHKLDCCWHYN